MRPNEIIERTEMGVKESNKILIQELMQDLEENGIQPVVAIDGEVKSFKLIDKKNELKDFKIVVEKSGLNRSDFCALEADLSKCSSPRIVMVVYKKLGKTKKYKAPHWVYDFNVDLKNKFFTN